MHHIEKLPSLKKLRVNNIPGLKILHTTNSMLEILEIVCDNSNTKTSAKYDNDSEDISITGFPNLQELLIDNNTHITGDMPVSLHSVTIEGVSNSDVSIKHISELLNKIPENILSFHLHNLPQLNPLMLVKQDRFHELRELSLSGCGINSVYALLSHLPSIQKLQFLDISNTPLSSRRIISIEPPSNGKVEFQNKLRNLIQKTCPALQELHI